jgi:hypothetical protein
MREHRMTTIAQDLPKRTKPTVQPYWAHLTFWFAVTSVILGAFLGALFDGFWHTQVPFDGFFSPPHVFIYAMATVGGLTVMGMTFYPPIRRAFATDNDWNVFVVPFRVPPSLFLLGAGMVMLGFAGLVLDNIWHTAFGLNETQWSFPHAMIGTGLAMASWGAVACRLALARHKPIRWYTLIVIGYLGAWGFTGWLGPLERNHSLLQVQAVGFIPVLANQPEYTFIRMIYEQNNLTRSNPALLIMAPVALGMMLALAYHLVKDHTPPLPDNATIAQRGLLWLRNALLILTVVIMVEGGTDTNRVGLEYVDGLAQQNLGVLLSADPANYRSLPMFLPTLLFVLLMWRWPRVGYVLAGVLFSLLIYSIWGPARSEPPHPLAWTWLLALPAGAFALLGAWVGERTYRAIMQPQNLAHAMQLILLWGVGVPFVTGMVDLYLRVTAG